MYLQKVWNMYTPLERRNIAIYIVGIMFYKFGLESFNGSITTLATDRFKAANTFGKVGVLTGLNQAMQCVGSILIAPLIRQFPTRTVLSTAILGFGILTVILMICDAATGGHIRRNGGPITYGTYNPNAIFPVFCATGVAYGMVELIRRVIPRDIVGGHVQKLKQMDATVHIFYEVAGTIGAFASAIFIKKLGNNYSFIVTPICFTIAGIVWRFVGVLDFTKSGMPLEKDQKGEAIAEELGTDAKESNIGFFGYFVAVYHGFIHFFEAVWLGGKLVLGSRKFCWLVPGYSFALFGHRYLENNIANIFAKSVLLDSSFQQIIVGGSNFGELLGAATVFFTARKIPTPIPFIRLDAVLLLIVWYVGYYHPEPHNSTVAWRMAATFIPISFGWAAGDVSLAAYIQSSLARVEVKTSGVSALGAVMSFLYVTYIVIYAILSSVLGTYVDKQKAAGNLFGAIRNISGVMFTVLAVIILISTLVPKGAIALNPALLDNEELARDLDSIVELGKGEKPPSEKSEELDRKLESESDRGREVRA